MLIKYLNDSRDPYLDFFQLDLIFTAHLSPHVSSVLIRWKFTEIGHSLHFYRILGRTYFVEPSIHLIEDQSINYY